MAKRIQGNVPVEWQPIVEKITSLEKKYDNVEKLCLKNDNVVDKNEFNYRLKKTHTTISWMYSQIELKIMLNKKESYEDTADIYIKLVFQKDNLAKSIYQKLENLNSQYNSPDKIEDQQYFELYNKGLYEYRKSVNELEAVVKIYPRLGHQNILNVHTDIFLPKAESWAPKVSSIKGGMFNITFKGESLNMEYHRIVKKIHHNIKVLTQQVETVKWSIDKFDKEVRKGGKDNKWIAKMTTSVSERLAKTSFPSTSIFDHSLQILATSSKECNTGDLAKSVRTLETFEGAYNKAVGIWNKYQEDTIGGAERAILWLKGIKFVSFTAVAVYTGGAISGALGGGSGAIATGSAVAAGGKSIVENTSDLIGRKLAGEKIEWGKETAIILIEAVKRSALAAVSAGLSSYISSEILQKIARPTVNFALNQVVDGAKDRIIAFYNENLKGNSQVSVDKLTATLKSDEVKDDIVRTIIEKALYDHKEFVEDAVKLLVSKGKFKEKESMVDAGKKIIANLLATNERMKLIVERSYLDYALHLAAS